MTDRIAGRTAIVFGGTSKIGPTICKYLAEEGANVVLHYNSNRNKAENIAKEILRNGGKIETLQADGTVEEEIINLYKKTVEKFGSVDVVVNLTHKYEAVSDVMVADMSWNDWALHIEAMKTHFNICKNVLPYMRKQRYGRIIFISGGLAYRFFKGCAVYSTVKAGLNAFCKTLALEEGRSNITVNIVSPGKIVNQIKTSEDLKQNRIYQEDGEAKCPLGRFATPDDVAKAVLFFSSSDSDGITGQTLYVSGGEIMPMP